MPVIGFKLKSFNLPSDTLYGNSVLTVKGNSTPGTPPTGSAYVWFDSSLKKWRVKYDDATIESLGVGLSGAVAHKDSHKSGGSDPFIKGDNLDVASRYIEDTADPTSDSKRIWLQDGGSEIRYWDDQGSPVKQTLANLGSAQTFANKIFDSTCDISAALLATGDVAFTNAENTFTGGVSIDSAFSLTKDITPPQITADQNNYAPTGIDTANVLRLSTDASRNITGITTGSDGRIIVIDNIGSQNIVLKDEDTNSTDVNRFALNGDATISGDQSLALKYDSTTQRWRSLSTASVSGAALLAAANLFTQEQTIKKNTAALIKIFRDLQTTTLGCAAVFEFQDSVGNEQEFGRIRFESPVNTDGSESGQMFVQITKGGSAETNCLQVNQIGNTIPLLGLALDDDTSPAQITADQNDYNPTNFQITGVLRLNADSSFRSITGLIAPTPDRQMFLKVRNVSNNTILLRNQNTASSAANRFDFGGYDLPLFAKSEVTLMYDITLDRWVCADDIRAHIIPPSSHGYYYRNDMFTIAADGTVDWFTFGTGAANSVSAVTSLAGHPGVVQHQTGTTSTGAVNVQLVNDSCILLGNNWYWTYEAMIRIPTLSTGTQGFGVDFGFLDNVDSGGPIDGVYAYADDASGAGSNGQWELICESNNSITANNSSTLPVANTWHKVKVTVYPDGTAELLVDGVSIATSNGTGVPTGAGRGTGFGSSIFKYVGTTSRNVDIDYIEVIGYANVSR